MSVEFSNSTDTILKFSCRKFAASFASMKLVNLKFKILENL